MHIRQVGKTFIIYLLLVTFGVSSVLTPGAHAISPAKETQAIQREVLSVIEYRAGVEASTGSVPTVAEALSIVREGSLVAGKSLGDLVEVKKFEDLSKQLNSNNAIILHKLGDPKHIGKKILVSTWNGLSEKNRQEFIQLLTVIELYESFYFNDLTSIITTPVIKETLQKDPVWFMNTLRAILLNNELFRTLADEDFVGKEGLQKAFSDPKGFSDAYDYMQIFTTSRD